MMKSTLLYSMENDKVDAGGAASFVSKLLHAVTATHMLHAALRQVLGVHVGQAGSHVAPDRLRFDFTHHGPMTPDQLDQVERWVNQAIWQNVDVTITERAYADAVAAGAMALFGEKYGDVVRVVDIPALSTELCGGCHVRNTGLIALFRIVSENGVSAGVRRVVAVTGPRAFELMHARERTLESVAGRLKVNLHAVTQEVLEKRLDLLLAEKKTLEKQVADLRRSGGGDASGGGLLAQAADVAAHKLLVATVSALDVRELQAIGDGVRDGIGSGVGVLGASFEDGKAAMVVVVSDAPPGGASRRVVKHSIVIAGHRTSISLEDAFWSALKSLATERGTSVAAQVARIDAERSLQVQIGEGAPARIGGEVVGVEGHQRVRLVMVEPEEPALMKISLEHHHAIRPDAPGRELLAKAVRHGAEVFAAHERAAPHPQFDLETEVGLADAAPKQSSLHRLADGDFQTLDRQRVLGTHVDIAMVGSDGERRDRQRDGAR